MDKRILENDIYGLVSDILSEFSAQLRAVGLTPVIRDITRWGEKERYQSEITIDFFDEGNLADVVEFFVYEDGEPIASRNQFETWFKQILQDVLAKRDSHGQC